MLATVDQYDAIADAAMFMRRIYERLPVDACQYLVASVDAALDELQAAENAIRAGADWREHVDTAVFFLRAIPTRHTGAMREALAPWHN